MLSNAEEQGLVGSSAHARDQARLGIPIVGVLRMDVIGWDPGGGAGSRAARRLQRLPRGAGGLALALARTVAGLVAQVSPALPPPQLHPHVGEADPGAGRSDHSSSRAVGHPARLVTAAAWVAATR